MLNKIIEFSVRNKLIIGLFTIGLIAYGSYQATKLPIDAVPDITGVQVQINTEVPALAAEESEKLVTMPIELQLAGLPGVEEMRSLSWILKRSSELLVILTESALISTPAKYQQTLI